MDDEEEEIERRAIRGLGARARDRRSPIEIIVGMPEFEPSKRDHAGTENQKLPAGVDYTEEDEFAMEAVR